MSRYGEEKEKKKKRRWRLKGFSTIEEHWEGF